MSSAFQSANDRLFERYATYLHGNKNGLFVTVSSGPENEEVRNALEGSAQRLGFAKGAQGQAVSSISEVELLDSKDLILIIETLDPLAVVASDIKASKAVADAYHAQIALETEQRLLGRPLLCFEDLRSKLSSPDGKKAAWNLLKHLMDHA